MATTFELPPSPAIPPFHEASLPSIKSQIFPPSPAETIRGRRDSADNTDSESSSGSDQYSVQPVRSGNYPLPPTSRENGVLAEDLKTPDSHVTRDPRLIRLTGIHPFNVEAPLSALYDEGFITTKDLHYVRNHGPVPKVEDEDMLSWEFSVEGMVEMPIRMTLRDLIQDYEQVTYPITLVCAGNRRKEQNVVRKTKGFSWGAAGLSTALWTGVALGDLISRAVPKRGARYVYFEGADKLPNGYYGTSVKLNWAMDPNRGFMVAHKMNGEALHPDHGKPLRIVIPGQIGGRSVKWLRKIVVTAEASDNWYHIYDNRVLPTMVTPEASADLPDTWKDERYAIYDLNTNSATCYPAHNETFSLDKAAESYKVRGYAYAGGGKRVTRVELTLDKGKSWTLAPISYPEDEYRSAAEGEMLFGGRLDLTWREACFCWCFWELDIPISQLQAADDIMVRAMDDSMMIQPRDMYWSVLGMMNNPWFRVVIHKEAHSLRFEHPTQPALMPGGWMERVKKSGGNLSNGFWGEKVAGEADDAADAAEEPAKEICMTNDKVTNEITLDEFKKHDGEEEPWFVVNGQVYDGTKFLEGHPGGATSIIGAAGQDVSEEFLAIHSENAKAMMPDYHIGAISAASLALLADTDAHADLSPRPVFLQPKAWSKAILTAKPSVSADTKIFTFRLDHPDQEIGLPVGQHLMVRLRDPVTREAIIRAYTPYSPPTDRGELRVLIKIYKGDPGGRMTQALDALPLGHPVDFRGPVGKFVYEGRGMCAIAGAPTASLGPRRVRRFVMVCGGSGVTPILAVLRAVLQDSTDPTECLVLDGNRTEEDILCRGDIDDLLKEPGAAARCRVVHTLSKPSEAWEGRKGRMDGALFGGEVGPPRKSADGQVEDLVLICGPEPMEKSVKSIFLGMGWGEEDLLFF